VWSPFGCSWLLLSATAAPAAAAQRPIVIEIDNDALNVGVLGAPTDGEYTHGMRLLLPGRDRSPVGRWLFPALAACGGAEALHACQDWTLVLGHQIYTPGTRYREVLAGASAVRGLAGRLHADRCPFPPIRARVDPDAGGDRDAVARRAGPALVPRHAGGGDVRGDGAASWPANPRSASRIAGRCVRPSIGSGSRRPSGFARPGALDWVPFTRRWGRGSRAKSSSVPVGIRSGRASRPPARPHPSTSWVASQGG